MYDQGWHMHNGVPRPSEFDGEHTQIIRSVEGKERSWSRCFQMFPHDSIAELKTTWVALIGYQISANLWHHKCLLNQTSALPCIYIALYICETRLFMLVGFTQISLPCKMTSYHGLWNPAPRPLHPAEVRFQLYASVTSIGEPRGAWGSSPLWWL